jgi:hypothetical protein
MGKLRRSLYFIVEEGNQGCLLQNGSSSTEMLHLLIATAKSLEHQNELSFGRLREASTIGPFFFRWVFKHQNELSCHLLHLIYYYTSSCFKNQINNCTGS